MAESSTAFIWAIANLERETDDGFVFTAHYTVSAADDTYSAAMDSVNLINELMALDARDDDQTATVARNVEHLEIMVAKDYWTTEDLQPLSDAIKAGID